jgi:hypothetical protein
MDYDQMTSEWGGYSLLHNYNTASQLWANVVVGSMPTTEWSLMPSVTHRRAGCHLNFFTHLYGSLATVADLHSAAYRRVIDVATIDNAHSTGTGTCPTSSHWMLQIPLIRSL